MRKTVRLRNINFNGVDTGVNGIRITGGAVIAAGTVLVEDCLIDGNFAGSARGISDERTGGGELYVSNTTVRNTGTFGIAISPAVAGQRITSELAARAGARAVDGARPLAKNGYKVPLTQSVVARTIEGLA